MAIFSWYHHWSSVAAQKQKQKYRYKCVNYYLDFNNFIMCFRFWPCTEIILHNLTISTITFSSNWHFECHAALVQWDQLRVSWWTRCPHIMSINISYVRIKREETHKKIQVMRTECVSHVIKEGLIKPFHWNSHLHLHSYRNCTTLKLSHDCLSANYFWCWHSLSTYFLTCQSNS